MSNKPAGTPYRNSVIRKMWADHTLQEIATVLNMSTAWIRLQGERLGLPVRRNRIVTIEPDTSETIREMWADFTLREISEETGLDNNRIRRHAMGTLGLPSKHEMMLARPKRLRPDVDRDRDEAIRELWPDHTLAEIGERFGISRERVRQLGAALGLQTKRKVPTRRVGRDEPQPDLICPLCGGPKSAESIQCHPCHVSMLPTKGRDRNRRLYEMRREHPEMTWAEISDACGSDYPSFASWHASKHAKLHNLPWPLPTQFTYRGELLDNPTIKRPTRTGAIRRT